MPEGTQDVPPQSVGKLAGHVSAPAFSEAAVDALAECATGAAQMVSEVHFFLPHPHQLFLHCVVVRQPEPPSVDSLHVSVNQNEPVEQAAARLLLPRSAPLSPLMVIMRSSTAPVPIAAKTERLCGESVFISLIYSSSNPGLIRQEMLASADTTVPFLQFKRKSVCALMGGVRYVLLRPDETVAPVFTFTRAQAVVLVVAHTIWQTSPGFTNAGVCVSVMPGVAQLESGGVTAWQEPVQELKPLFFMPQEFAADWHAWLYEALQFCPPEVDSH